MKLRRILTGLLAAALMLCGCSVNSSDPDLSGDVSGASLPKQLPPGELVCYSFSAGKADAHLIYDSEFAILIDCGEKGFGKEITEFLEAHDIRAIDMLIISHFDKDHVGGAAKVIKSNEVRNVFQPAYAKQNDETENYRRQLAEKGISPNIVRERQTVRIGSAELTFYPPMKEIYAEDQSNNSSLMVSVRYGSKSMLFTGDAEDLRLSEFISTEKAAFDVLKVPYHGHFQMMLSSFLKAVDPQIAVITCSDSEPEDDQVIKMLSELGCVTYLTRKAPVMIRCDGSSVTASYVS